MKTLLIEKQRVSANIAKINARAGEASVYAVLKGNAYGLGLLEIAEICRQSGISRFALTDVEDAIKLRQNGFHDEEILMLRSTSEPYFLEALVEYNLVGTIGSQDVALAMSGVADKRRTVIEAHIEIDTGMGRYGFLPSEFEKVVSVYKNLSNVALTGIYTHFSRAYDNEKLTRAQTAEFTALIEKLRSRGIEPGLVHAANSSALFRYDFCNFDAVRVGSAITGRMPSKLTYGLQRVGLLVSNIAEVRWVPSGTTFGYGGVYRAKRAMRIAVIPVGYADGFCMEKSHDSYRFSDTVRYMLSSLKRGITGKKLYVTINGVKARVIGHVGMLHTTVDVTDIDCSQGDLALFDVNPMFTAAVSKTYE